MYQSIGIIGEVNITQRVGKKVIYQGKFHNTITRRLATGLVSLLAEQFNQGSSLDMNDYIPSYLGIGSNNQKSSSDFINTFHLEKEYRGVADNVEPGDRPPYRYSIVSKETNLGGTSESQFSSVSFRVFISPDDLIEGYVIKELGLYSSSEGNTLLSRVQIPDNNAVTKVRGSGIDIVWNIIIAPGEDVLHVAN